MTATDTRGRRTGLISNFLPKLSFALSVVDHGIPPPGAGRYKSISRAIPLADRREGVIYKPMPSFRSDLLLTIQDGVARWDTRVLKENLGGTSS